MRNLILLFLITISAISGCNKKAEAEDYIARVNKEYLSLDEFKATFSDAEWGELDNSSKEKYLDEWVSLTLLAQECDKKGLSKLPIIQKRMKNCVKKIKANAVIAAELLSNPTSEEELFSYYQLHKAEYRKESKEYKYQRIMIKDKSRLEKITKKLHEGAKFKDLAIQYSEESAGRNGGYMGFVSENQVSGKIWETLEALEQYNWKSVKSNEVFYLLRWYEKRELEIEMPFSDVKAEIDLKFQSESRQEKFNRLKKKLDNSSIIEKKYFF